MSKKGLVALVLLVLVSAGGFYFFNQKQEQKAPIARVETDLQLQDVKGKVVSSWDNHSGLSASGSAYAEIQLKNDAVEEQINNNENWKPLPMDEAMQIFIYGLTKDGKQQGPIFCDDYNNPVFPHVSNGYYFFVDRSPEAKDNDAAAALKRGVSNASFGLYDIDSNTLYYGQLDV